jgi:hypothetical protein
VFLLVEEKFGLLGSTGKTRQKLVIALIPFTAEIPVPGYLENLPRMVQGTRPVARFQPGTHAVVGNCCQAMITSSVFAGRSQ